LLIILFYFAWECVIHLLVFNQKDEVLIRRESGKSEKSLVEKLTHSMNFRETQLLKVLVPFAFSFGICANDSQAICQVLVYGVVFFLIFVAINFLFFKIQRASDLRITKK
jgi:uncharacterized membrane protein